MADNYSLPVDFDNDANVWCEDCQQSLAPSRAKLHLASKKHAENVAARTPAPAKLPAARPAASKHRPKNQLSSQLDDAETLDSQEPPKAAKPTKSAKPARILSDEVEPQEAYEAPGQKTRPARAAASHTLPPDPSRPGYYWCGVCKVSLSPTKAGAHLNTATHANNEKRVVDNAMHRMKLT